MLLAESINYAVKILQAGGLIAFPTETVYGLGADASQPEALTKIFIAKQRPMDHPLIVHIPTVLQLSIWAREIPPLAFQLADAFWPGPLTLILKKSPAVSDLITGHQDTIGLRIPAHPVALALLKSFGGGIAAPSANRFGRISPTSAEAVREELGGAVDLILEGGDCEVGLESTILDLSNDVPVILRPGMITAQQIEAVIKVPVLLFQKNAPRVSGSLESHYAPQTKMVLMEREELISYLEEINLPVAVLVRKPLSTKNKNIQVILMPEEAKNYAHDLYRILRELDHRNYSELLVERVPLTSDWIAIDDRLKRASFC